MYTYVCIYFIRYELPFLYSLVEEIELKKHFTVFCSVDQLKSSCRCVRYLKIIACLQHFIKKCQKYKFINFKAEYFPAFILR